MSPVALSARTPDAVCVLCGGASRRMGRDKARVELGGATLLERAVAAAERAAPRVLLATGAAARYPELGREVVLDRVAGGGPLAGIEAALAALVADAGPGGAWLGLLACDMPFAEPEVIARCVERGRERGLDVVHLASDEGPEPLYGAVHTRCLPAIRAALDRGERRVVAFHPDVRAGVLRLAELPPELRARRPARNVNTPDELDHERRSSR